MPFPVSQDLIEAAERQLGRKLPQGLRLRLMRNNGGDVVAGDEDWILHPVWDPTDRRTMARTANHMVRETEQARNWRGFPKDAIALASDGSGNRLIIKAGSDEAEMWDHETGVCSPYLVDWTSS